MIVSEITGCSVRGTESKFITFIVMYITTYRSWNSAYMHTLNDAYIQQPWTGINNVSESRE